MRVLGQLDVDLPLQRVHVHLVDVLLGRRALYRPPDPLQQDPVDAVLQVPLQPVADLDGRPVLGYVDQPVQQTRRPHVQVSRSILIKHDSRHTRKISAAQKYCSLNKSECREWGDSLGIGEGNSDPGRPDGIQDTQFPNNFDELAGIEGADKG